MTIKRPERQLARLARNLEHQAVGESKCPPYLAEGEMAVVKPEGERFSVVARLPLDAWLRLE